MKKIFLILCLLVYFGGEMLNAQSFTCEGEFLKTQNGKIYILDLDRDTLASGLIEDHKFKLTGKYPQTAFKKLTVGTYLVVDEVAGMNHSGPFFIEANQTFQALFPLSGIFRYKGTENLEKIDRFLQKIAPLGDTLWLLKDKAEADPNTVNELKAQLNEHLITWLNQYKNDEIIEPLLAIVLRSLEGSMINPDHLSFCKEIATLYMNDSKIANLAHQLITGQLKTGVGKKAVDFTLNQQNGEAVSLSDIKSKYILLNFWSSWCSYCIKNFDALTKLDERNDLQVIGISIDENKADWEKSLQKYNLSWINLWDDVATKTVALDYAVAFVPYYVLINQDGEIIEISSELEKIISKIQPE